MLKKRNIIVLKLFLICGLLLFACKNNNNSNIKDEKQTQRSEINEISKDYFGNYSIYTETEATTTGMASITYDFTINKNGAKLETNTYHEPIRCNGKYKIIDKADYIELYYDGEESNCKSEYPDFEIKKDKENFFIKGVGNEATASEWVQMNKK